MGLCQEAACCFFEHADNKRTQCTLLCPRTNATVFGTEALAFAYKEIVQSGGRHLTLAEPTFAGGTAQDTFNVTFLPKTKK